MITPEYAHDKVKQLVHKFKALSLAARKQMNEDATRQGYILPLFRALDDERQRRLAKRIEELDRAIDAAVYQLYGLTEEEIRVVEGKA
jgi:adenine-specific DNA-methyltransferase